MIISLIGMSGVGKTTWSQRLEKDAGFTRITCDDIIEKKLGTLLTKLGYSGTDGMAKWMGLPYEEQYIKNSEIYLELERQSLVETLDYICTHANRLNNIVIDTTGSVIYLDESVIQLLKQLTTLVYLETTEHVNQELFNTFVANPKPIYWGYHFNQKHGEEPDEAVKRCFPEVIAYRSQRYAEFAHVTVDYEICRNSTISTKDFISYIIRI